MIDILLLVAVILIRISIVWFMYNNLIELLRSGIGWMIAVYSAGVTFYTVYTFNTSLNLDVDNPIRLLGLIGLSLMLGVLYKHCRHLREKSNGN